MTKSSVEKNVKKTTYTDAVSEGIDISDAHSSKYSGSTKTPSARSASQATISSQKSSIAKWLIDRKSSNAKREQIAALQENNRLLNRLLEETGADALKDLLKSEAEIKNLYITNEELEKLVKVARQKAAEAVNLQELCDAENKNLEKKIKDLLETNAELQERVDRAWKEIDNRENLYKADGEHCNHQMEFLRFRISVLQSAEEECDDLKKKNEKLMEVHTKIATLEAENKRLQHVEGQLEKLQDELEFKEAEIQTAARWHSYAEPDIEFRKTEISKELIGEFEAKLLETAKAHEAELKAALGAKDAELSEKTSEIEAMKETEAGSMAQLEDLFALNTEQENMIKKQDADFAEERMKHLDELRAKDKVHKEGVEAFNRAHEERITLFKRQTALLKDSETKAASLETGLKSELAKKDAEVKAVHNENAALKKKLAANQDNESASAKFRDQIKQLQAELEKEREQRDVDVDRLNDHINDMELHLEDVKDIHAAEIVELKKKADHPLTTLSRESKKQIATRDKKIECLDAQNADLKKKLAEMAIKAKSASQRRGSSHLSSSQGSK
jgi:myosin heavy subunit